jgi:8-oxo-dGTP pyrophosphatase MutT (NUDIX family)
MSVERPAPGEELNTGAVAPARQAASLILVRDSTVGLEVLLVQRNPAQRFMGGAWVFPGGSVKGDEGHLATALRELDEEAGVRVDDPGALVPFSRWITPAEVKIRFDTHFFVAEAPSGAEPAPDGAECVDARWLRPGDALDAFGRGQLTLVFPTIKHLEQLAEFRSVAQALDTARGRDVRPVQPRVLMNGDSPRVVLPGEPGYED